MGRNSFLLFIIFALEMYPALAQEKTISLKHISSSDGLSDNQVTCILQDKLGFMWIGTRDGLNRYDGHDFYIFKNEENNPSSVCGNNITCLEYDADSILWIGTASSGFCSYDFRTGKFRSYNKSNTPIISNNVNAITFDHAKNHLWIGLNNYGLYLFDLKAKKIIADPEFISKIKPSTYYDVEIKDSVVYLAPITGFLQIAYGPKPNDGKPQDFASTLNKIFIDSENKIWCGAWDNALHEFSDDAKHLRYFIFDGTGKLNFSGDEIVSIAEDENKILWCGTKVSGIHFFDLKTKSFTKAFEFLKPVSSRINFLYPDKMNRMWIGSETGLFVYNPLQNQFQIINLPVPAQASNCKVYDRHITKGGKEFIVSGCGLFYKIQSEGKYAFKEIIYNNESLQLTSIFSDYKDRIFIGTNKTVFLLDTVTLNCSLMKADSNYFSSAFNSISSSRVNSIVQFRHKKDTVIAISFYGHWISLIHPEKKNIFYLIDPVKRKSEYLDNLTRKLYVDSKNNFWICGASQGVTLLSVHDSVTLSNYNFLDTSVTYLGFKWKSWKNSDSHFSGAINDVYDMIENADGSYWLTTQGSGLAKFYPEKQSAPFESYKGDYKSLQGIAKTGDSNLWVISSTGLLNYNVKTGQYKLHDKKNGIPESLAGYFFNCEDSIFNAGFDGGYISFNPYTMNKDYEKPRAGITRLWIMDMPSDSLLFSEINLNHDKNFIKFYISSNCFSDNEQITYMYTLEGIDDNWRNNHKSPLISYTNLPPGNFTLKIKAISSDGIESEETLLPVTISPPFYRTIPFYTVAVLLLTAAAFGFYRYRIRQLMKLHEVRNKIARDLHDDIGSTLSSIHLYSQIANKKLNSQNPDEIKSILEKIESSSSEIIDKTGDAVWAVKASNDSLKNLVLRIESYAASLLGAAGIRFNIVYDERISGMKLDMTQRKNIFLIYKEAIHNILKYSGCTEVNISIAKNGDKLTLIITDNGNGFVQAAISPYNGNGIRNMKSRAMEIGGSFRIASRPGKGTEIEVSI